jgi:acyl-CoA synthetase (AMP-forming)/AMP-acid ligase II
MLTHRDQLRRSRTAYGDRPAVGMVAGPAITHRELDELTGRLADGLLRRGLGPGDRMLWIEQNCVEYLIAYYATAKIGMTISPMNYWLRAREIAPLAELVDPAVVVAGEGYRETVAQAVGAGRARLWVALGEETAPPPAGWSAWDELFGEDPEAGLDLDERTVHEIIFTSGTTGQSKGVMRTQRGRIIDSMQAALGYQLNREDHMLWFLPQFHIGGAAVPNQVLMQGGRVSLLRRFDAVPAARALADGVTYVVGVPAHYSLMRESGALEGLDLSRVRGCYVGGSAASREVFDAILRQFPNADLVHGYGSTESGPHTMALRGEPFMTHFGALGLPVPGTEVRVVDPATGAVVPQGSVGELQVRSDAVMEGYLGRPDLTAGALDADGWLRTGDLVTQSQDGYFTMVDRAKEMIITGGENVYPREVEDVLATHPAVAECAVIGVPDEVFEERVVAYVRIEPGAETPSTDLLIAYVRERLAGFKTPKELHVVDDLPRTGVGKIAKQALREAYAAPVEQKA